jgi:hypothetical protein
VPRAVRDAALAHAARAPHPPYALAREAPTLPGKRGRERTARAAVVKHTNTEPERTIA